MGSLFKFLGRLLGFVKKNPLVIKEVVDVARAVKSRKDVEREALEAFEAIRNSKR